MDLREVFAANRRAFAIPAPAATLLSEPTATLIRVYRAR